MKSTLGSTVFAQRNSARFWATLLIAALVVVGIGVASQRMVKSEIRHLVEANLIGTRQIMATTVHAWANTQVGIVSRVSTRPQLLRDLDGTLRGQASSRTDAIATLSATASSATVGWWAVVDGQGSVVLSSDESAIGKRVPPETPIAEALSGTGCFSKAIRLDAVGLGHPCFLACSRLAVPGHDLVLIHAHDPTGVFTSLFKQAYTGETMEAYAFDEKGLLLTDSRFVDQLKAAHRLPADAGSANFRLELRDPLSPGADPDNPASWPLTHMAAQAVSGHEGANLDGFRDYRGVPVVGAWTWCPQHHIGLAVKMDAAEAFRALTHLSLLFYGLLALLMIAAIVLALFLRRAAVLARKAREAERQVQELGQYTLERKLGEGGMGAVYTATHRLLRRTTAVKLISGSIDAETLGRFEREVRLCSRLTHPNTIAIYDYGRTADGVFYYAMEHLDGMDLEHLVEKHGVVSPGRAIHILVQACGSLGEAHHAKLLHRDIKPANIFLTQRGGLCDFVKVLDFGLVKELSPGGAATANLSKAGIISGTPPYMAPEVIGQKPGIDGRVDLYALALVGVYLLTGKCPFERGNAMQCLMAHLNEPLPSLSPYGTVPADLERALLACLAKDPAARPADAEAFANSLLACADANTWTQRDARAWWQAHPSDAPAASAVGAPLDQRIVPTTRVDALPDAS